MITIYIGERDTNLIGLQAYKIPVTPTAITIDDPQESRRDVLIGRGELAEIGMHKPTEVTFASFFPVFADTYTAGNYDLQGKMKRTPMDWVNLIKRLQRKPILLSLCDDGEELIYVSGTYIIDKRFQWQLLGGSGGDIEYRISFVHYQPNYLKRVDIDEPHPVQINTYKIDRPRERRYIAQIDDSWISIAESFGLSAYELMQYNEIDNKFHLLAGDNIRIPAA